MDQGRVRQTPTGFGVIAVTARKQITVPTVDVPSLSQVLPARRSTPRFGVAASRIAPAQ